MKNRRAPVVLILGSVVAIGLVYLSVLWPGRTPDWAPWLMVVGVASLMVSTAALGAGKGNRLGRIGIPLLTAWAVLVIGFGLALAMPAESAASPLLWLGVPRRTALILYGVGIVPLFAMPLAYALTFDDATLSEQELRGLREAAARIDREARVREHRGQ